MSKLPRQLQRPIGDKAEVSNDITPCIAVDFSCGSMHLRARLQRKEMWAWYSWVNFLCYRLIGAFCIMWWTCRSWVKRFRKGLHVNNVVTYQLLVALSEKARRWLPGQARRDEAPCPKASRSTAEKKSRVIRVRAGKRASWTIALQRFLPCLSCIWLNSNTLGTLGRSKA